MTSNRIGIIYTADGVFDKDFWDFAPPDVSIHITRVMVSDQPLSLKVVTKLSEDPEIELAAERLRPIAPGAIAYASTSVSFARGPGGDIPICERIKKASGIPATTTSTAIGAACRALGISKVAVATPYVREITDQLVAFLADLGISTVAVKDLGLARDIDGVSAEEITRLATETDCPAAEGLLISCTNLSTASVVPSLESRLGKPVITANQATVWHACRLAGAGNGFAGVGRLWRSEASAASRRQA
jgi:maleate isomerase